MDRWTGRSAGLAPNLAIGVGLIVPVTHQAAIHDGLPHFINRRNGVARRQRHELIMVGVERRVAGDKQRSSSQLNGSREGGAELAFAACVQDV